MSKAKKSVAEDVLLHARAGFLDERIGKRKVEADMVRSVEGTAILPADAGVPAAPQNFRDRNVMRCAVVRAVDIEHIRALRPEGRDAGKLGI